MGSQALITIIIMSVAVLGAVACLRALYLAGRDRSVISTRTAVFVASSTAALVGLSAVVSALQGDRWTAAIWAGLTALWVAVVRVARGTRPQVAAPTDGRRRR